MPLQTQTQKYENVVLKSPTSIVHLEYAPDALPSKPSEEWTRFVCISDTHTRSFDVPDGDVLLHSGDLTNVGTEADFKKTMDWLYELPHKVKIIIAGNHDLTLDTEYYERECVRQHIGRGYGKQRLEPILKMLQGPRARERGIVYLQDQLHKFQTKENGRSWAVYGSPWSLEFCRWAFAYEPEDAMEVVAKFPKADILLTHGPPYQILDRTLDGTYAGCEALRNRLPELRPRLHLFGHIHEAHGADIHSWNPVHDHKPPTIQNDGPTMDVTSRPEGTEEAQLAEAAEAALDRTVFVNAANWPMGRRSVREGVRFQFGGPGFQAVVVDLKD